jgi:hypothetical protein
MRAVLGVALLLLCGSAAFAEEPQRRVFTCDKDTVLDCELELPCDVYVRTAKGDIMPDNVQLKIAKAMPGAHGDFNQEEFNRAIEKRCGKIK